ncbi:uncharacterized protein LOC111336470 [Stylophora pistillata]|uniref:uncharacterized protein LOC111336470 n=1 Tax=Stylophora pistillata TaxID=50429 RepID=UPI000C039226|nr:uncharacterized protein LOC111336470 [Stylophora pistillata]
MSPNKNMTTAVLPLGYHCDIKPNQTKQCDLPQCNISSLDENWTLLHGCHHSFHDVCLEGSTSCPLCKGFLEKKVKELGGRPSGSNACTVISVLAALHFLEGTLQIPKQLQDLSITIPMYINLMIKGNQLYDSFNLQVQQPNLEVREVLQHGQNDKNVKKLEIVSDLGFFTVRDLEDHLTQHHHVHQSLAAVLIVPPDNSMVLCFNQTSICLFEMHGLHGGIIATSSSGHVSHFVKYLDRMAMRDWKNGLHGSNLAILRLK